MPIRGLTQRIRTAGQLTWLAVRLSWQASPLLALGVLLLLLLQALVPPVQLALSRAVIDRAAVDLGFLADAGPIVVSLPLGAWIVLTAVVVAVGQLIQPFAITFQNQAGDWLTGYITEQLIRAANRWQGMARFEDPRWVDDLERSQQYASQTGLRIMVFGASAVLRLFTVIGIALLLIGLHPLLPLLLLLASVPQTVYQWRYERVTGFHLYVQTPEGRQLDYNRDQLITPEPAKDVRLYALGPFFGQRYSVLFDRLIDELTRLRQRLVVPVSLAACLGPAIAGAVYVMLGWRVASGHGTPGELVLYGGAAFLLQRQLVELGSARNLGESLAFLTSVFRVLHAPSDLSIADPPRPVPRVMREGIVFEHVAFTYPGQKEPILRDVSFTLHPGECLALVGQNGAGKTTVVKLLLRFYDPSGGRILLDGTDLREYDPADLRREMGVIFQDFVRYEFTARENIGLGQVGALGDSARLQAAASKAGAGALLGQLPKGLDTRLGREFGGRELSGGEWQKLALARAFMRDCALLVLDEPTAALDVQTEYEVYQRFQDLTRDRMSVLISHRFSTVRMADRILYLADGRIQEAGTHEELLVRNGDYARQFHLQAAQYAETAT
ncbi:MAG: ABC transporter ATP-binding protein [Chloroflexota bacterium]|nr:ABC transporter ATP-binding protein [Chloroflexota bacterium]